MRTLLFDDDERYRREAEAMVPTTLDRLADNRQRLKQLRDRKEKERLELVQQKYLQQAAYVPLPSGVTEGRGAVAQLPPGAAVKGAPNSLTKNTL